MLKIDLKDKIISICDDNFTRAKIDSIKLIVDKYGIRDILDFKLTFTEDIFGVCQQSAEVILSKSITVEEFYEILTGMFEEMVEENPEDFESVSISIEALFIL